MILSNLMTEKRRLDTAAAAMVHRMTSRSKPRVFLPVSPSKNLLPAEAAIFSVKYGRSVDV